MSDNHVSTANTEDFRKLVEQQINMPLSKMAGVAVVSKDELNNTTTNQNDVSIVPNMSVLIEKLKRDGIEIDTTSVAVVNPEEMNELNKNQNNDQATKNNKKNKIN